MYLRYVCMYGFVCVSVLRTDHKSENYRPDQTAERDCRPQSTIPEARTMMRWRRRKWAGKTENVGLSSAGQSKLSDFGSHGAGKNPGKHGRREAGGGRREDLEDL